MLDGMMDMYVSRGV